MTHGALAWTACLWAAVIVQSIQALVIQYPKLNSNESIHCECTDAKCQAVVWFWHPRHRPSELQYLYYHNVVDNTWSIDKGKYKGGRKMGWKTVFSLMVIGVAESDAGRYFCQTLLPGSREIPSLPGVELRPGEKAPTPPPPPPPPKIPLPCRCRPVPKNNPRGCGYLVLWPLMGVLASLAVVLIATLFYFSRLPKKCRHRLVKKQQLR
ncbi:hypothetical protein COCON_G00153860 [Conger conger]|uniref:Uncharacterized protein n=1 Tax=Conger conger TaxID=82655 RepID=A0A9Q1HU47_CONCO|nr:uncharacterized protein LOC133140902 [Conger conger]KAJ8262929.1 hypothetical protein COCON_G00153860 [Conger conger]